MKQELEVNYVIAVAEQLSFVSAFLGGVTATILITVVMANSDKKAVSLLVGLSAFAACSLLTAVISSWRLSIALHPDLPLIPDSSTVALLWKIMIAGYGAGVLGLITSIGVSGWLRSKTLGVITTFFSVMAIVIFATTSIYDV